MEIEAYHVVWPAVGDRSYGGCQLSPLPILIFRTPPEGVSCIINMLGSWIKTNMIDGLSLVSLDSSVEEASRSDFYSLILRMKEYRSIVFTSKFAKLEKH
jgi:hypothetical protein